MESLPRGPVKIAYLMMVHNNPLLQQRAIRVLSCEGCAFFIHVDGRADIRPFSGICGDNVTFAQHRIAVYWSEFSFVEATLLLMKQALSCSANYDYFVLMQGADYPLRSGKYIQAFFSQHRGAEFLSMVKLPAPGFPLSRISTAYYPSDRPVRRLACQTLAKIGLAQRDYRRYLEGFTPYAGDACWALSRAACTYVVDYAARHPQLIDYFRCTFVPEESFFHTIIGNSFLADRVRRSLLYREYPPGLAHPAQLAEKHVQSFESEDIAIVEDEWGVREVLFARKFSDRRIEVIDKFDEMIARCGNDYRPSPGVRSRQGEAVQPVLKATSTMMAQAGD